MRVPALHRFTRSHARGLFVRTVLVLVAGLAVSGWAAADNAGSKTSTTTQGGTTAPTTETGDTVTVPDVTGEQGEDAVSAIEDVGLTAEPQTEDGSERVPFRPLLWVQSSLTAPSGRGRTYFSAVH